MNEPIYLRLTVSGLPCWHRVRIAPGKWPLVKKLQAGVNIDVTQLGTILASGWGEPPQPIDYDAIDA